MYQENAFELDYIRFSMRKFDLRNLRKMFDVPRSVSMRLPKKGEKASEPQEENVAMFKVFFDLGLQFPLQSYFVRMLSGLNLVLCQLVLNL